MGDTERHKETNSKFTILHFLAMQHTLYVPRQLQFSRISMILLLNRRNYDKCNQKRSDVVPNHHLTKAPAFRTLRLICVLLSILFAATRVSVARANTETTQTTSEIGCVGNLVWLDKNFNGRKDSDENGYGPITLDLVSNNLIIKSVSSENGYFELCHTPGDYTIRLLIPNGLSITKRNATDEYHDSDADQTGEINVKIVAGRTIGKYDFGLATRDNESKIASVRTKDLESIDDKKRSFNFGPWVEYRHRTEVFERFNSALLWAPPNEIIKILNDAERTSTTLILQLGSAGDWGWQYSDNTSDFTIEKWFDSTKRFTESKLIRDAIQKAIDKKVIRSIYLIDEPHHKRWDPSQQNTNYITNNQLDQMAQYIKTYWPDVKTSVRASPRALASYNRGAPKWTFLDEAFVMINYNKWAINGTIRTINGMLHRESEEAKKQGLGIIGSIQMLIGSPETSKWWDSKDPKIGTLAPVGKLQASPLELSTYTDHFIKKTNLFGFRSVRGTSYTDTVMIFRWDRNNENDWKNPHYNSVITNLINLSNGD
jgi:hypothetical protein